MTSMVANKIVKTSFFQGTAMTANGTYLPVNRQPIMSINDLRRLFILTRVKGWYWLRSDL